MPSSIVNDSYRQSALRIRAYKTIKDKHFLVFKMFFHCTKYLFKILLRNWMVDFSPVNGSMCFLVIYNISVIWRPSSKLTSFHGKGTSRRKNAFFSPNYILNQ